MNIIDRRLDPGGKSLGNRQRFIRRARSLVRQAVREASASRKIREIGEGGPVVIPADGVHEPTFRTGSVGVREHVLPGNKEFVQGDRIPRPDGGAGGGGAEGSPDGQGEDQFSFVLTSEEFLELFLSDLELPNLAKRQLVGETRDKRQRAGFQTSGPPAALSVPRTLRRSLSRRIALRRPGTAELDDLRRRIADLEAEGEEEAAVRLRAELERQERRSRMVPFIDPLDLRFRRTEAKPEPVARAVMFCLMDVSASMDERMKDIAKRFFSLLYVFLKRRYRRVDIVFIRHTHEAKEVDEDTFFHSRESGGTVISSALDEMIRIAGERYPADQWNIYAAQASDGDNFPHDNDRAVGLLRETILPMSQYYAYLEVGRFGGEGDGGFTGRETTLWGAYRGLARPDLPFAMRRVDDRRDIYPVFRQLFERRSETAGVEGA